MQGSAVKPSSSCCFRLQPFSRMRASRAPLRPTGERAGRTASKIPDLPQDFQILLAFFQKSILQVTSLAVAKASSLGNGVSQSRSYIAWIALKGHSIYIVWIYIYIYCKPLHFTQSSTMKSTEMWGLVKIKFKVNCRNIGSFWLLPKFCLLWRVFPATFLFGNN